MELILTELTRRQMRELERNGGEPRIVFTDIDAKPVSDSPRKTISPDYQASPLTRRQLREMASNDPGSNEAPLEEGRLTPRPAPLPPIGKSREHRNPASEIEHEELSAISSVQVEIPEQGFRGANYLGEPSTQSIMLEVAPEAISLPLDTGEVFSTGSISILSESSGTTTGGLDGLDLDREEEVTGVISIIDPVSAKDFIDERSPLGVVPSRVLMRGWWRPWLVGVISLVMAITAILASITIFNALGA